MWRGKLPARLGGHWRTLCVPSLVGEEKHRFLREHYSRSTCRSWFPKQLACLEASTKSPNIQPAWYGLGTAALDERESLQRYMYVCMESDQIQWQRSTCCRTAHGLVPDGCSDRNPLTIGLAARVVHLSCLSRILESWRFVMWIGLLASEAWWRFVLCGQHRLLSTYHYQLVPQATYMQVSWETGRVDMLLAQLIIWGGAPKGLHDRHHSHGTATQVHSI